ncbi:MAG: YHS domain-containing protein [Candidatus Bathyarchaeia archaeon]
MRVRVWDPVCGMQIEPATAYGKTEYKGTAYYFCSQRCQEEFKKKPEKYTLK